MTILPIANEQIQTILGGTPTDHKHLRFFIQTDRQCLVFSEATIANLVRAYVILKTHPVKNAIRLMQTSPLSRKADFATVQLLETNEDEKECQQQIDSLWQQTTKVMTQKPANIDN